MGGEVPPTNPVGLDPTKPGETTASVQQFLPGCSSETGRITGVGAVTAGCERYPVQAWVDLFQSRSCKVAPPPNRIRNRKSNGTDLPIYVHHLISSSFDCWCRFDFVIPLRMLDVRVIFGQVYN